jgi:predicted metalloendopeptidase
LYAFPGRSVKNDVASAVRFSLSFDGPQVWRSATVTRAPQRFFLTFAQTWCAAGTPEMWQRLAKGDSHAWEAPHVNGLLPNLPEFAQAFACRAGQPMVKPPEQIYGQGRPPQRHDCKKGAGLSGA